jgi:hypothetical protein
MSEEEAVRRAASGEHIYKTSHDPRFSWALNWFLGIIAVLLALSVGGTFSMLFEMRDKQISQGTMMNVLISRPEPASREQVAYLQKQIDDIRGDIIRERERARQ